jgi:hypothetical protein
MLRTKLLAVLSLLLIASITTADEKRATSPGVPPLFRKVFGIDQQPARLILVNRTVRFMPEEVTRKGNRDGNADTTTQTKLLPVYEEQVGEVPLDSAQVSEAGGKQLSREDILKRVAVGTIVVISADGKPVDPAYLKTLANDTLVIVSPAFAMQASQVATGDGNWSVRPVRGQLRTSREAQPKP